MAVKDIKHAMWTHGHSMQIEEPDGLEWVHHAGSSVKIKGTIIASKKPHWFHFAIPTPVIVDGTRLRAESVLVRFRSTSGAWLDAVHVYDGENKIASKDNLNLNASQWHAERVYIGDEPGEGPEVLWGIGVSLYVDFTPHDPLRVPALVREIEFSSVGCDFLLPKDKK